MTKKILVPIDGSEASFEALKYAAKMADVIGKDAVIVALEIINIDKYRFVADSIDFSIQDRLLEERKRDVENHLNNAKDLCEKRGINIETITRQGFPHEEIIKCAHENEDIKLVVMGASGKGFLDRHILGSVTTRVVEEVSRKLPCPVVVTPYKKGKSFGRWNLDKITGKGGEKRNA